MQVFAPENDHIALLRALTWEFLKNPPRRQQWREFYRLLYDAPPLPIGQGEWVVTNWDDVVAAMSHEGAELTAIYPATRIPQINELLLGMLPHEHGPEHRRLRAVTRVLFTDAAIRRLHDQIVAVLEDLLYPTVFISDGCDVVNTLGLKVPEALSCILLDVAPDDREVVGAWAREIYRQIGKYDQSEQETRAAEAVYDEFREYVMRRTKRPQGTIYGGVGEKLLAARRTGALNESQLLSYFALFLLTGLDTLTYAIGNAICFLGSSPDVFERLRHSPELAEAAFREAMRLWGPIRLCVRHLQQSVELPTVTIPQDSIVFILIHAANRDPKHTLRPDNLRWDRSIRDSLAFGVGPHGCLGGALGTDVGRTLYYSLSTKCRTVRTTPHINAASFIPSLPILGIDDVRLFAEPA